MELVLMTPRRRPARAQLIKFGLPVVMAGGLTLYLALGPGTGEPSAEGPVPVASSPSAHAAVSDGELRTGPNEDPATAFVAPPPLEPAEEVALDPATRPAAIAGTAGQVLDEHPGVFPGNLSVLEQVDGTYLVVDTTPTVPLPDSVTAVLAEQASRTLADAEGSSAQAGALEEFTARALLGTGRTPVIVTPAANLATVDASAERTWAFWTRVGSSSYTVSAATKELAVDAAHAWVAEQESPEAFVLVMTP